MANRNYLTCRNGHPHGKRVRRESDRAGDACPAGLDRKGPTPRRTREHPARFGVGRLRRPVVEQREADVSGQLAAFPALPPTTYRIRCAASGASRRALSAIDVGESREPACRSSPGSELAHRFPMVHDFRNTKDARVRADVLVALPPQHEPVGLRHGDDRRDRSVETIAFIALSNGRRQTTH